MDNNTSTSEHEPAACAPDGGATPSFAYAGAAAIASPPARARRASASAPVRRFDPRVSLACILLIGFCTFVATSAAMEALAVGGCVAAGVWCGRPASALRWAAAWAALLAAGWLCVQVGAALVPVGMSLTMIRRMLCAFMMAANMVAVTRTGELACGLQRLGLPKRASAALCVMLRFAPTLGQEFGAVRDAMKVRGIALTPARAVRHPAQVVENLLVPVVGRVGIVADELANAAAVRGIDAPARRTSYYELRLGAPDALLLAYFASLALLALASSAGVLA